jgi:hypothetical protein
MIDRAQRISRRKFLASTAAALTLASGSRGQVAPVLAGQAEAQGRKPIAVLTTVYRPLSHSYHIAGRFLHGYQLAGKHHLPKQYIRSVYVDQVPDNDLSRELGKQFGFKVTRNVEEALIEDGKLAVEGVLIIAEHGNYKRNEKDQILYPRHELFSKVVDVFRKVGKVVPVFNDKHFSYSWAKCKEMMAWARELKIPFMAGSSLPVTWRRPELELPLESPIEDALVACYGPLEVYGFHALETLQTMLERRKGGETGLVGVTCLTGKEVWKAGDAGRWSWELLDAALSRSETLNPGDVRANVGTVAVSTMPLVPPTAFLLEYKDGTRGTILLLNGHIWDFNFAARLKGEAKLSSTMFVLPPPPGARFFDAQVMNLEKFLETGSTPYPVERTLLTSGALDFIMESHHQHGNRIETPELASLTYRAPADSGFIRGPLNGGA